MMHRNQIIDLLTTASAYDRRTVGEGDIAAWSEAAHRAGWKFDQAVNAIHDHYASTPAWLMPGHITQKIREYRRAPAPAAEVLALEPKPASAEARRKAIEEFARRKDIRNG